MENWGSYNFFRSGYDHAIKSGQCAVHAHFYDRRATSYAKNFLFDEAIECHAAACQELDKSYKLTNNNKAIESIALQYEYHKKQKDFLRLKKLQYQTYKEALRVQKEAMSRIIKARGAREKESLNDGEGATLKKAIFRTIEEADSLLEQLVQREEEDVGSNKEVSQQERDSTNATSGSKKPKDETTVIEELKIVNYQLRSLINELMNQLASSEKEVQTLRERLAELEAENRRLKPESTNASAYSSPFVFSPSDEIPPSDNLELPTLAPLELPIFDLTFLHNKNGSSADT